ncbi:class I SAM-dependent methyltransferase [Kistimonas scapharcae]|uniref:Class I SAM-dependent methyltransferase n=1 Tax=Kistimonas scapharcae TaxID=1036133 RepID=A0ABP8V1S0_9GAMM
MTSIAYYDQHCDAFVANTASVDMTELYTAFLSRLKPGAHILDAGCGSGRDTCHFLKQGYHVTAIDGSVAMVRHASAFTGINVRQLTFENLDYQAAFEGIWACASLLHIPLSELPDVMARMSEALKNNGIWYLSFKYGAGEVSRDGRSFTNLTEESLGELVDALSGISLLSTWQTSDKRSDREDERWLNALCKYSKTPVQTTWQPA